MLNRLLMAGTWALVQAAIGFAVAFLLTGSFAVALGMAMLQSTLGSFAFLLHERAWRSALRRSRAI